MWIVQSVTLNDIQLTVFNRIESASGLMPFRYQSKKLEPSLEKSPHAEIIIAPMNTRSETVDGGDILPGYILINIHAPKNHGAFHPASEGQKFLDLFPRDLRMNDIRIKGTGTIQSPADNGKGWDITPVLIEYEADSCQINA